jgi:hypothetical protein
MWLFKANDTRKQPFAGKNWVLAVRLTLSYHYGQTNAFSSFGKKKSAGAVINIIIRKSSTVKQATAKVCELRS